MTRNTQDAVGDLTISEVARIRRCSTDTVRRHHAAWTRDAGFPEAVSLEGVRGLRWSRAAVLHWEMLRSAGANGAAATDWAAVAAARSAMIIAGLDPDAVAVHSRSVPTAGSSATFGSSD